MATMLRIGDTVQLKAFLWDGLAPVTGATLNVSIERVSDSYYWTGSAFQADYIALEMTERTGNAHKEGDYIYSFTPPTTDGVEAYNWSCKYADDPTLIYAKGRIQTYRQATVTLGAVVMTTTAGNRISSPAPLEMFQETCQTFAITVRDAEENVVDLSEKTLRFNVIDSNNPPNGVFKVEGESITVSGDGNEIALVEVSESESANASAEWKWRLVDSAAKEVLAHGGFAIETNIMDVT